MSITGVASIALHTDTGRTCRVACRSVCTVSTNGGASPPSQAIATLISQDLTQEIKEYGGRMSRTNMADFVEHLGIVTVDEGKATETTWEIRDVVMIEYFPKWNDKVASGLWHKAQSSA